MNTERKMKTLRQQIAAFYLEYLNDFLTVERFAEYHDMSINQAQALIDLGREFHNEATL
jgi:hypothetical protein